MKRLCFATDYVLQKIRNMFWHMKPRQVNRILTKPIDNNKPVHEVGWWSQLGHFPAADCCTHRPCHILPEWMDRGVPWIASLERLYSIGASWPGSISPEAGLLLHSLILNVSPRVVIETGTYMSVSTHWIAGALNEAGGKGRVHSFDKFRELEWVHPVTLREAGAPSHFAFVRDALVRAGLADLVELHSGDSPREIKRAAPAMSESGVELAFIDGDHTIGGVMRDFLAIEPLLTTGGYIVLHDIFPDQCGHTGPRHLLDLLASASESRYSACAVYTSPHNYGMAVLQRIS